MNEFKIGDVVRLKRDLNATLRDNFEKINIKSDMIFTISNIGAYGGLGFENGWEKRTFREDCFEQTTLKRKSRISNLFKEDSND